MNNKAFSTDGRGFHITFPNGVILSTQFGAGNYCENFDSHDYEVHKNSSDNCEIAIIRDDGVWITDELTDCEDVKGYVSMVEWLEIVDKCRNYSPSIKEK